MTKFEDAFVDHKGYGELRKVCRQGNDFCKEIANILNERAKIEQAYADGLSKLASKAQKTTKDTIGTLKSSWENVIKEMECEADVRRTLSSSLHEEGSKQVKAVLEGQIKTRKIVEAVVDKAYKTFSDKLSDTIKAKRNSHSKTKESEALHDQLEDSHQGKGKPLSEKDISKMESKCRKSVESAKKSDKEYRELYEKAELCRLEWASAMKKYCQTCEKLEEERLTHLREMFSLYGNMLAAVVPQLQQSYESVKNEAWNIDPSQDVLTLAETRGSPRGPAEQILYDCYEGDLENGMNVERRQEGLESKIRHLSSSLEREKKTREGITTLFEAYAATPGYTDEEGHHDVATQLTHVNAVIDSLNGSLWKLHCALANLKGAPEPSYQMKNCIECTRDKQGMLHSTLKVPLDQVTRVESQYDDDMDNADDDFDDFPPESAEVCQCRVLYDYEAKHDDELTIKPGDIIKVTVKLDGGWWQGEMNGRTGIFPATYVEEIG